MASRIRQAVPLKDLADYSQIIEIEDKVGDFERLAEVLTNDLSQLPAAERPQQWRQNPVDIRLRFGWTDECPGIPAVEGTVESVVAMVCQRCLVAFDLPLAVELKLLLVEAGEMAADCEGYEAWEFEETDVSPAQIVEEALVMALPLAATHDESTDCGAALVAEQAEEQKTALPFADLKSLLAAQTDKH